MSENSKEGLASENYTNSNIPECSDQGKSKMEESSKKCVRSDQKTDGNQTQKVSSEMDANVEGNVHFIFIRLLLWYCDCYRNKTQEILETFA